ncbi:hypothetical protein SAMN05421806_103435 [Streptomyces indicus]|uniref:Uncharacterized protein n=1 Tax=Streptomyces indicus TaxID=417292 RepID=A0A1G8XVZ3_9ACTN|nr:hypothetical protein SAMN05421806_103435 [Streptomyces indicus]
MSADGGSPRSAPQVGGGFDLPVPRVSGGRTDGTYPPRTPHT